MKTGESLLSIGKFIAEYSAHLMGAGVHTSRVVRNTKRIGEAFGLDVKLSVFHRNIILTIIDKETNEACNEVIDIPAHPISFEHNSELSALSWEAVDNHLSLEGRWKDVCNVTSGISSIGRSFWTYISCIRLYIM